MLNQHRPDLLACSGLLEEDSIAEKIKQRTQSQRVGLWACRIVSRSMPTVLGVSRAFAVSCLRLQLGMVINLIILGSECMLYSEFCVDFTHEWFCCAVSMLTIVMVSLYQEDVAAFCKGTYFGTATTPMTFESTSCGQPSSHVCSLQTA